MIKIKNKQAMSRLYVHVFNIKRIGRERVKKCLWQSIDFLFPGTCFKQPMIFFNQSMSDVPWSTSVTYRKHTRDNVIIRLSYSIKQKRKRNFHIYVYIYQISNSVFEAGNRWIHFFSNHDTRRMQRWDRRWIDDAKKKKWIN